MPVGTPAMTAIGSVTLSATATDVTFTIPSGYRDLVFVYNGKHSTADENVVMRFNSDAGSNYSYVYMLGAGSGSGASGANGTQTYQFIGDTNQTAVGQITATIFDYTQTDKHKTVLSRSGSANTVVSAWCGRWASTTAISTLTVFPIGGTFAAGSTFTVYGVSA